MEAIRLRKLIAELQRERDQIDYAIRTLETFASGRRLRGRPPKIAALLRPEGRRKRPRQRLN